MTLTATGITIGTARSVWNTGLVSTSCGAVISSLKSSCVEHLTLLLSMQDAAKSLFSFNGQLLRHVDFDDRGKVAKSIYFDRNGNVIRN